MFRLGVVFAAIAFLASPASSQTLSGRVDSNAILVSTAAPTIVLAHGGGLDARGCHNDRQRGEYHCHQGPLAGQIFRSAAEATTALAKARSQTPVPRPPAGTPRAPAVARAPTQTDAQIKAEIIRQSIAGYSGSCPCPYNTDRAGRRCGARSAYSRPGGASPMCYVEDVPAKLVLDYRSKRE